MNWLWILSLAWTEPARAEPVRAHVGLLAEGSAAPLSEKWHVLLEDSQRYHVVDPAWIPGRRHSLSSECREDPLCWRDATRELGLDLLAIFEPIDTDTFGIRVIDVRGQFRRATISTPEESQTALHDLFLGNGRLQNLSGHRLRIDGRRIGPRPRRWPAGKFAWESASGLQIVLVRPNETTVIDFRE